MRLLFFLIVLIFASAPFWMAQADESTPLKCAGATALQEDEMPFKADDDSQAMNFEREGKTMRVSIGGFKIVYKDDERFVVEDSSEFAAVREKKSGDVVLSLEKVPLEKAEKRWGTKAKYLVRGVDPRNGQNLERPVEVLCEKKI